MSVLVHVAGVGRAYLPPFGGHLVRNLAWDRFQVDTLPADVDVVVLSSSSPGDAASLVADLRNVGRLIPVVVLRDDSPGWESLGSALPQVHLASEGDLYATVTRLTTSDDPTTAEALTATVDVRPHVPRGGSRSLLHERLGDGGRAVGIEARRLEVEMTRAAPLPRRPEAPVVPADRTHSNVRSPAPTAGTDSEVPPSRRSRRDLSDPDVLVPALVAVTDRLYGVRETGTAVAGHVRDSVGVDAVAVLIPDGAMWTVAGAVGHRHLEERLTLTQDHWLVHEVTTAHHGIVIEDTDIARTRLAGTPLAAWPHLMACPLSDVGGIVVLARSDNGPPFTSRDLTAVSTALGEASGLFKAALQVRELARRLRTLADLD